MNKKTLYLEILPLILIAMLCGMSIARYITGPGEITIYWNYGETYHTYWIKGISLILPAMAVFSYTFVTYFQYHPLLCIYTEVLKSKKKSYRIMGNFFRVVKYATLALFLYVMFVFWQFNKITSYIVLAYIVVLMVSFQLNAKKPSGHSSKEDNTNNNIINMLWLMKCVALVLFLYLGWYILILSQAINPFIILVFIVAESAIINYFVIKQRRA